MKSDGLISDSFVSLNAHYNAVRLLCGKLENRSFMDCTVQCGVSCGKYGMLIMPINSPRYGLCTVVSLNNR